MMVSSSDMRVVISQSPAAERIQNVQQQHSDLSQREFALKVQDLLEQKNKEVQDTEKTEGEKVEKDREKGDQRKEKRKRKFHVKEEEGEEGQEMPEDMAQGRLIDIRV